MRNHFHLPCHPFNPQQVYLNFGFVFYDWFGCLEATELDTPSALPAERLALVSALYVHSKFMKLASAWRRFYMPRMGGGGGNPFLTKSGSFHTLKAFRKTRTHKYYAILPNDMAVNTKCSQLCVCLKRLIRFFLHLYG